MLEEGASVPGTMVASESMFLILAVLLQTLLHQFGTLSVLVASILDCRGAGLAIPAVLADTLSMIANFSPYAPAVAAPSFATSNGGGPRICMMSGWSSADARRRSKSGGLSASVSSVDGSLASL